MYINFLHFEELLYLSISILPRIQYSSQKEENGDKSRKLDLL